MMTHTLLNRTGLAAIAAATALTATPVMAQVVDPAPASDSTSLSAAPAPVDSPAATTTTTESTTTKDPLAPVTRTRTVRTTSTKIATRATARPVGAAAPVARTAAAAPAAAPVTTAPVAPPPAAPALVAPVPEAPVTATPTPVADTSSTRDDMLPIAGAAGLGLLALAGAGIAMSRRRRRDEAVVEEETWTEPAMARTVEEPVLAEPVVPVAAAAAPVAAASAFNWGEPRAAATPASPSGLSRTELAYQGPTPDNPSLSLKKRLKRAAFFDQREREVAAGEAVPIEANAGLPEAVTEELDAPPSPPGAEGNTNPSMNVNRTMQPA